MNFKEFVKYLVSLLIWIFLLSFLKIPLEIFKWLIVQIVIVDLIWFILIKKDKNKHKSKFKPLKIKIPTKSVIESFRKSWTDYFKWLITLTLFLLSMSFAEVSSLQGKHPIEWKPLFYEGWFFLALSIIEALSLMTFLDFYAPLKRLFPNKIWKFFTRELKGSKDGKIFSLFLKLDQNVDCMRFLYLSYFLIGFNSLFVVCIKNIFNIFNSP